MMKSKRILLAEDNLDDIELTLRVLAEYHLDNKMPRVDGLEVVRQIKTDERRKTIPVVMLTSSHEQGDLFKSYELGVNAYVIKPVKFYDFVNAVREIGAFWGIVNEPPPQSPA